MGYKALLSFEVKGQIKIEKEDDWYIASFPSLNITSQGKTIKKAKEMLVDAIKNVIEVCFERGTLLEYLKKHNYKVSIEKTDKKQFGLDKLLSKPNTKKEAYINIPIYLAGKVDKDTRTKTSRVN